ncbi:transcriptional regulator, Spx/MgsR family [Colwellia chukchiensis]|uniref:Transcriptional regulator, Spx/MgsR family n=1 Tax=Colwellia chukchiensis TaxID=641665 RepID=A0A1H7NSD8_9GAMM|nr:ArsC family reductase [Colwellia chukchiensis]SEL25905.1 transcriptional regulator, Spx/MgsR family [Colwellia chukchiensis]
MTVLYGIKNCDSVKKAKKWLEQEHIPYQFHDFRSEGFNAELLQTLLKYTELPLLLNKRSTTFRNVDQATKDNLTDEVIKELLIAQPTLIKRPLLQHQHTLLVGFKAEQYQEVFA